MNGGVQKPKVTLILWDDPDKKMLCRAFYLEGDKYLYMIGSDDNLTVSGRTSVSFQEHFTQAVTNILQKELADYVHQNLRKDEMYNTSRFWENALLYAGSGFNPNPFNVHHRDIQKGIVRVDLVNRFSSNVAFNIHNKCLSDGDGNPVLPLDLFFNEVTLDQAVAYQQHLLNLAPPEYDELARMNQFLQGKKHIRATFPGNQIARCWPIKKHQTLTAAYLFRFDTGRLTLYGYNFRDIRNDNILLETVRFRKEEFVPDMNLLRNIENLIQDEKIVRIREKEAMPSKIRSLLPQGVRYAYSEVWLLYDDASILHHRYHPWRVRDVQQLLDLPEYRDYVFRYPKKALCIRVKNYYIGTGQEQSIPREIYAIAEKVGMHHLAHTDLVADTEETAFSLDGDTVYQCLNGSGHITAEQNQWLQYRYIISRVPPDNVCRFCTIQLNNGDAIFLDERPYRLDVEDFTAVKEYFAANPQEDSVMVRIQKYRFGPGFVSTGMTEDLRGLILQYGLDDFRDMDDVEEEDSNIYMAERPENEGEE